MSAKIYDVSTFEGKGKRDSASRFARHNILYTTEVCSKSDELMTRTENDIELDSTRSERMSLPISVFRLLQDLAGGIAAEWPPSARLLTTSMKRGFDILEKLRKSEKPRLSNRA